MNSVASAPTLNIPAWLRDQWLFPARDPLRSKYVRITDRGTLKIDPRYYTEHPVWERTMKALARLRHSSKSTEPK